MKKILLSLLLSFIAYNIAFAQAELTDANVVGHVIDKKTGEHLPYVTIRLIGTNYGTMTDATGHYFLKNVENGNYEIEASCIGYVSQCYKINIKNDVTQEINFHLLEDVMQLEQIVVTGNKGEVKRRNSSTLVNVLNAKTFDLVSACSLADGLNYQPGVRVENNCQNCGFTQVRINGLDGHYSQVLMNSRPVFSALAGVYGLEQIPANMIDRVEVMRGGGSALFGSSSIGGTINIITKDPIVNSAEVANTTTFTGMEGSIDNNTTINASVTTDNHKLGVMIFGQNRDRASYDHNGDGYTEIGEIKSKTIGARTFMRPSDNTRLTLEYRATEEFRRGGDQLDKPAHETNITEQTDHQIHGGDINFNYWSDNQKVKWNVYASMQDTKRDSYYGSGMDPNAYGNTHDLVIVGGAQYTLGIDNLLFMPAEFMAGAEYNHNYLHDVTIGYDHDYIQKVNIYSGFVQNEWRNDMWGFLVGARFDKHTLVDNAIVSPRANIRFNPTKNANFRLSYSTGFRAPQAFDEDFHIAVVGGERVVTVLDDELKEENSHSISLSSDLYFNIGTVQTNLLVEGFYTTLNDVFALRTIGEDALGNEVLERYNGSGATVFGGNIELRVVLSSQFSLQGGMTLQRSRYKEPEQWSDNEDVPATKDMFRTPDAYGYFTMNYNPIKPLTLGLTGTFTGPMYMQHFEGSGTDIDIAERTKSFTDIGFKAAYDFKLFDYATLQLNAGIHNIFNSFQDDFDTGEFRDSGYMYGPMLPRSAYVGVKINL
ncbi:MAG: TonB-dependent receptor [Bacteroidales bacterium]|nr:TonB-dependent receptor [Bacteroidales bacterium]